MTMMRRRKKSASFEGCMKREGGGCDLKKV
jgi:hypothetical protein